MSYPTVIQKSLIFKIIFQKYTKFQLQMNMNKREPSRKSQAYITRKNAFAYPNILLWSVIFLYWFGNVSSQKNSFWAFTLIYQFSNK